MVRNPRVIPHRWLNDNFSTLWIGGGGQIPDRTNTLDILRSPECSQCSTEDVHQRIVVKSNLRKRCRIRIHKIDPIYSKTCNEHTNKYLYPTYIPLE